MENLRIEYLPLDALKPYARNARKHEDLDVDNIAESISRYGMNDPIGIWSADNIIVEGHGRALACKKLGMDTVPCIRLDHMDSKQRREYAIAHNATAELSRWDADIMPGEIADLDLSGFDFDLGYVSPYESEEQEDDLEERERIFRERMARGEISEEDEEYQEFLNKFELKKTTDDCYTPALIYDAVADYVSSRYGIDKKHFVRPFYPGGDYQNEQYKSGDVVVDNPPFSILAEIIRFYAQSGVKFFLFAPHLTVFSSTTKECCSCLVTGVTCTYENGANVNTSFVTNMESCAFRSAPDLYQKVKTANDKNLLQQRKELPKYAYPSDLVIASSLGQFSRLGIRYEVAKDRCVHVRQLDAQKDSGKAIFGSGYLIAEREKAEREKAEREKAERWELSERERELIRALG